MGKTQNEEQVPMNIDNNDENVDSGSDSTGSNFSGSGSRRSSSPASDSRDSNTAWSCTADSTSVLPDRRFRVFTANGMEKLDESNPEYEKVKAMFVSGMGSGGGDTTVEAIHKISATDPTMKARLMAFKITADAVAKKNGGNLDFKEANLRYGWYGGSKGEIVEILGHGFSGFRAPNRQSNGLGVHLNAQKFGFEGALLSTVDENGLKHILMCRVIMGMVEKIDLGSKQSCPRSKKVDSGLDNLINPRKYIVWNAYMNSRIVPVYVISFKSPPSLQRAQPETEQQIAIPSGVQAKMQITKQQIAITSGVQAKMQITKQQIALGVRLLRTIASGIRTPPPSTGFGALMYMLERHLTRSQMQMLARCYMQFKRNKITRQQLIQMMRQIVGDRLLARVIKTYGSRVVRPGKPRG